MSGHLAEDRDPLPANPPSDEQLLIERVRAGDAAAFETIVYTYSDRLLRFAHLQLHTREAAEDIVQEVFGGIWLRRERWMVNTSIATYLFQAVRKRIVSHRAAARRDDWLLERLPAVEDLLPANQLLPGGTDATLAEDDLRKALARGIALMPERCRQVFLLQRQGHLTYREVAAALGISVKTVEVHMAKALSILRSVLADWLR